MNPLSELKALLNSEQELRGTVSSVSGRGILVATPQGAKLLSSRPGFKAGDQVIVKGDSLRAAATGRTVTV
jgi:hypothetical protein